MLAFGSPFLFSLEKRKMSGEKEKRMAVASQPPMSAISRQFFFFSARRFSSFCKKEEKGLRKASDGSSNLPGAIQKVVMYKW